MGVSYRWTSARALLDLDIPSAATAIELPVAAPSPIRGGEPARVRVAAGGIVHEMVFARPDVQTIRIPLDTPGGAARTRLLIDIQVHPTFIPSRLEPQSRDHRVLGVQVLRPRFVTSASLDTP